MEAEAEAEAVEAALKSTASISLLGRMDGRRDKQKSPCVLQDFVPFRAAALLPLTSIQNHAKQGNGYR